MSLAKYLPTLGTLNGYIVLTLFFASLLVFGLGLTQAVVGNRTFGIIVTILGVVLTIGTVIVGLQFSPYFKNLHCP